MLVLISEVWGGFSPEEAMRFLGELAQARNDGIDIERASTTCVDVVLHLLPRPAALADGAVGGRDRDTVRVGRPSVVWLCGSCVV